MREHNEQICSYHGYDPFSQAASPVRCSFSPDGLREFGIVHAPTFISRNNIVAITYHTDNGPVQNVFYSLNYKFNNDIPTQIIRDYENMFWCHISDTATLLY